MSTQPTPPPGYEIIPDEDLRTKPLPVGYIVSDRDPNDLLWLDGKRAGKMVTEKSIASLTYARPLPANQKPEWQPIATAPKDGTRVLVLFYEDCVCSASYVEHAQGGNWYSEIGTSLLIEPTHWMPLPLPPLPNQYEYHNPAGLTDKQVGVKDGWRLCLKTETEHEGCEWSSPGRTRWKSDFIYEGESLNPGYTYRTRRPLPESSTEPKEGGDALWSQNAGTVVSATDPTKLAPSNAAAGTSNPFQYRRK